MHDDDESALTYVLGVAVLLFCMFLFLWPLSVQAKAMVSATIENGQVRVTLYDEPCKVPAVQNLPGRAVWIEGGKEVEGCWGTQDGRSAMFYWADMTVVMIPLTVFRPLSES